jgi:hypothetical protein
MGTGTSAPNGPGIDADARAPDDGGDAREAEGATPQGAEGGWIAQEDREAARRGLNRGEGTRAAPAPISRVRDRGAPIGAQVAAACDPAADVKGQAVQSRSFCGFQSTFQKPLDPDEILGPDEIEARRLSRNPAPG